MSAPEGPGRRESAGPLLATERLILRRWRRDDLAPFAELNADPLTMRYFPAPLERAASDALVGAIEQHFDQRGFGLWAVEAPGVTPFIGMVGLWPVDFDGPGHQRGAVEIGWRLHHPWWGRGYATEAARAALTFGFTELGLDEIVSFTAAGNQPSRAVMTRIGMTRDPAADFDHPRVPPGPLTAHVLYRLAAPAD